MSVLKNFGTEKRSGRNVLIKIKHNILKEIRINYLKSS